MALPSEAVEPSFAVGVIAITHKTPGRRVKWAMALWVLKKSLRLADEWRQKRGI
jgi:hypothetical protein